MHLSISTKDERTQKQRARLNKRILSLARKLREKRQGFKTILAVYQKNSSRHLFPAHIINGLYHLQVQTAEVEREIARYYRQVNPMVSEELLKQLFSDDA